MCHYCTIPEILILVHPKNDENVIECLVLCISILSDGATNDEILNLLSKKNDHVSLITKGRSHLQIHFVYLKKVYELE